MPPPQERLLYSLILSLVDMIAHYGFLFLISQPRYHQNLVLGQPNQTNTLV